MKAKTFKTVVRLTVTHAELVALDRLIASANADGDATEWYRSAGCARAELNALDRVTEQMPRVFAQVALERKLLDVPRSE